EAELDSLEAMYKYHLDRVRSETLDRKLVDYRLFYYDSAFKTLDDGLDWLKHKTKADDVVATAMPHWAYLRDGLKAVRPPLESKSERVQALLDAVTVAYVVLDNTEAGSRGDYVPRVTTGNNHAGQ